MRVLVVHQGALGDTLMVFPALSGIKKKTGACIDFLCRGSCGELARTLGLADAVFSADSPAFSSLYSQKPDPALADRIGQADRVLVFGYGSELPDNLSSINPDILGVLPRPPVNQDVHTAFYVLENLSQAGLCDKDLSGLINDVAGRMEATFLNNMPANGPILLAPGSGSIRKCWALDNFIKLSNMLEARGQNTVFLSGPAESDMPRLLKKAGVGSEKIVISRTMEELVRVLSRSFGLIANDSGVTHLAGLMGKPVVAVFGPSDPLRWRPLGKRVAVVRPELTCSPCFEKEKKNCQKPVCIKDTRPEEVLRAWKKI